MGILRGCGIVEALITDLFKFIYYFLALPGLITKKIIDRINPPGDTDGELKFVYVACLSIATYFSLLFVSLVRHSWGLTHVIGWLIDFHDPTIHTKLLESAKHASDFGVSQGQVYILVALVVLLFLIGSYMYASLAGYTVGLIVKWVMNKRLPTWLGSQHFWNVLVYILVSSFLTLVLVPRII
jgi:hypothetical protein